MKTPVHVGYDRTPPFEEFSRRQRIIKVLERWRHEGGVKGATDGKDEYLSNPKVSSISPQCLDL
ncbi:MAG: hypothetical protein WCI12_10575, partial [Actinomycetes bacterium]